MIPSLSQIGTGLRLVAGDVEALSATGATTDTTTFGQPATNAFTSPAARDNNSRLLVMFSGAVSVSLGSNMGADLGWAARMAYFASAYVPFGPPGQGLAADSVGQTVLRDTWTAPLVLTSAHFRADGTRRWTVRPYFNALYSGNAAEFLNPYLVWAMFETA